MRSRARLTRALLVITLIAGSIVLMGHGPSDAATSSCFVEWGSLPKTGDGDIGGPTRLVNIRSGRHECFDRLVFDLDGPEAGYRVRYVDRYTEQGSGNIVPLRGGADLEIILEAPAHDDELNPTYTPPSKSDAVDVTGYSTFRQVHFSATFEGETQTGLGVRARLPFRAFTLAGPDDGSRLVVDVAHRWYPRPTQPTRTVNVYFNTGDGTDCELVSEFNRDATGRIATVRHSLDSLVAGPTAEEQAQGAFSPFSAGTAGSISSVSLKSDGLLVVDFRNVTGFDLGGSSSCGYGALTSSLNTTVFQFPVVKRVRYQTNGSCDNFFELLPVECTVFER